MKLLDLLVKELPGRGWPEGYLYAAQDGDSELCFFDEKPELYAADGVWMIFGGGYHPFELKQLATDYATAVITREEYEQALAAKTESAAWDGKRFPPVGTVCEFYNAIGLWIKVEITAIGRHGLLFCEPGKKGEHYRGKNFKFRPIRTPEQIEEERRNKIVDEIIGKFISFYGNPKGAESYLGISRYIYENIKDGNINGVKIDE